jgi:hypothetical protein
MRQCSIELSRFLALTVLLYALAACNGGNDKDKGDTTPTADNTTPEATATSTPSVEDEVSAAYLKYWDVYADAVFSLDGADLPSVMTGSELDRTVAEIDRLRQQNRAAKIEVEHNLFIVELDPTAGAASVRDEYANHSYFVNADTKEIIGQPAGGEIIKDTYFLTRVGETWKVRDSVRNVE